MESECFFLDIVEMSGGYFDAQKVNPAPFFVVLPQSDKWTKRMRVTS